MRVLARILCLASALGGAVLPASCASSSRALDPGAAERYPDDFAIDATVLEGPGIPESLRAEDQQAKYIVLPDGALLAETGAFLDISTRPGRTRWLYEEQVQWLWAECARAGFLADADANGPPNPDLLVARRGERLVVLTFRADGSTWSFVRRSRGTDAMDPAAARLLRSLAMMAWIPDLRPEEVRPERYDFGPDPYTAYRAVRDRRGVEKVQ